MRLVPAIGMKPLFAWQEKALAFLETHPAAALFSGIGTGKTRVILEDARRKGAALIVVCPKTALAVWEEQIRLWEFTNPVLLTTYDRIWREPFHGELVAFFGAQAGTVMAVLDESHLIKNGEARRTIACLNLPGYARYRRVLSGTPVLNEAGDLTPQEQFLLGGKEPLVGAARRVLRQMVFSASADDVLDLPEATDVTRVCELGAEGRKVYRSLEQRLRAEINGVEITAPNALVKVLRLAELTGGFLPRGPEGDYESVDCSKRELLEEVLDEIGDEPFVIACRFTIERHAIERILNERGIDSVSLHGDQWAPHRAALVKDFQDGEAQALVSMIQVGSMSIDLSRSRIVIFYSVGWPFGDYEQFRGRIRRQGQTRPQVYIHLIAADTIDQQILLALERKKTLHEFIKTWWGRGPEGLCYRDLTPEERKEVDDWWSTTGREGLTRRSLSPRASEVVVTGTRRLLGALFPEKWGVH